MPFSPAVREEVLVKSKRTCCVCRVFQGGAANVHHMIQEADGGNNTIENAICLCYRCHYEAGNYNSRHPLGIKYSPSELRSQRDQWWDLCSKPPSDKTSIWPRHIDNANVSPLNGGSFDIARELRTAQKFLKEVEPIYIHFFQNFRGSQHPGKSISREAFQKIECYRFWRNQQLGLDHPDRFFNEQFEIRRASICKQLSVLAKLFHDKNYQAVNLMSGNIAFVYQAGKILLDNQDVSQLKMISDEMKLMMELYDEFSTVAH